MARDRDSTERDRDGKLAEFAAAVSSLSDGELTFQAPFDLSSSAALAANIDSGALAERLFEVTALRECGFDVRIVARSADLADEREVLNTSVASSALLVVLLETLLDELHERIETETN